MTSPPSGPLVAVIGPVNMDLFIRGRAPLDVGALNEWVGPSEVDLVVAGSVGYTVQVLRRLGCRVGLFSATGDDAFGAHIRQTLADRGIGIEHVLARRGGTAIAIYVMLFGGIKRPMTYRLPGFEPWPDPPGFEALSPLPDLVHCGGLLHFPNMWHRGMAGAFEWARSQGITTSLDPQFPLTDMPAPWSAHIDDVLAQADVLFCDEGEGRMIFAVESLEAVLEAALGRGCRTVAVKRGAEGAVVADAATRLRQPTLQLPAEQVREAVGAGDAFDAGFLTALLEGKDLASAARFATAAAVCTLGGRGGAEGLESREAVEKMLPRIPQAVPFE
jgi:2-dehydro-3-deoxygluconokinase